MKTGLVWFKNDLRLHDNEALAKAMEECDQLVFFFCVEEYIFSELKLGFRKAGINRFVFLQQAVKNLQKNLEAIDGHLIIKGGTAAVQIKLLVEKYEVATIYAEQEYASEELEIVSQVQEALPKAVFNFYWGKSLYNMADIPYTIETIPLTSRGYRIPTGQQSTPRPVIATPTKVVGHKKVKSTAFPAFKDVGFTKAEYESAAPYMHGGEDAGLERLQEYTFGTELLTGYRWSRNRSQGKDYSSKFSPYLALGCLSPREIYRVVQEYEATIKKNQSSWWLIFELVWRDYFTFKGMRFGNKIFFTKGYKNKLVNWENDPVKFTRWQEGKTGIPFIDAHMRQLNQTGYMSNRGRVNCASYFVYDLNINWTWGAAYFESKLIDYDVSSNWLNWHMQAFEIYYTNPVHQANKYKAEPYIREWIPELAMQEDTQTLVPWEFDVPDYPKPIEVFKKWTRAINLIKSGKRK